MRFSDNLFLQMIIQTKLPQKIGVVPPNHLFGRVLFRVFKIDLFVGHRIDPIAQHRSQRLMWFAEFICFHVIMQSPD